MTANGPNRWEELTGHGSGQAYADRLAAAARTAAAAGDDVHGEANLVSWLAPPDARILDAGCGTGRVAIELDRRGFAVVGVDVDPSMLEVAARHAPNLPWILADLATIDLAGPTTNDVPATAAFDVVVAAGNVVPLMAPGTEPAAIAAMARHLVPGGHLVAGFGLDAAHLPLDDAPVTLDDYDQWCVAAGLRLHTRWATWNRDPFDDGGYAVSMHTTA